MILFCDTTALIKLYVKEEFSTEVHAHAALAKAIALARIAWAEAMAALARRVREYYVDAEVIESVRTRLRHDWSGFAIVEVTTANAVKSLNGVSLNGIRSCWFMMHGLPLRQFHSFKSRSLHDPSRIHHPQWHHSRIGRPERRSARAS